MSIIRKLLGMKAGITKLTRDGDTVLDRTRETTVVTYAANDAHTIKLTFICASHSTAHTTTHVAVRVIPSLEDVAKRYKQIPAVVVLKAED